MFVIENSQSVIGGQGQASVSELSSSVLSSSAVICATAKSTCRHLITVPSCSLEQLCFKMITHTPHPAGAGLSGLSVPIIQLVQSPQRTKKRSTDALQLDWKRHFSLDQLFFVKTPGNCGAQLCSPSKLSWGFWHPVHRGPFIALLPALLGCSGHTPPRRGSVGNEGMFMACT